MPSRDKKWKLAIKLSPFNLNKLAGRGGGGGGGAMIEAPDNLGQFTPITIGLGSWATLGTTERDGAINASWKTVADGEWRVQTAQHLVTGNQEGLIARAQDASHNEWLLNAISINRLRVYQVCGRVVAAATVLIGL